MKKLIAIAALAALTGCVGGTKIQVIDAGSCERKQAAAGFSDETYVWESWTYTTNAAPVRTK